jgi:hypothetical protein
VLAKAAGRCASNGSLVWCDPQAVLYPPALAGAGIALERLFLLRPKNEADEVWAVAECLRCKGVAATIASPRHLSRIEARRLQLAAEDGGGVGILLRRSDAGSTQYAAATRWLVTPALGERTVQRWRLELLGGHGGLIGKAVVLEVCRESHTVRAFEAVGDRPSQEGRRQKAEGGSGNWQAAGPDRGGRVTAVGGGGVAAGHRPWSEAGDDAGRSAGIVPGAGAPAA